MVSLSALTTGSRALRLELCRPPDGGALLPCGRGALWHKR